MFKNSKIFTIILFFYFIVFLLPIDAYGLTYSLNYDKVINEVKKSIQEGQFNKTENLLESLNESYPNNPEILYLLGKVLFWQKKYKESLEFLLKAYQIKPTDSIKSEIEQVKISIKLEQARELENDGKIEKAKDIYISLFENGKNMYESGYYLGMIYFKERDYKNAADVFKNLVSLYPKDIGFKELYAEALILNKEYSNAKEFLLSQPEDIQNAIKSSRADLFCRVRTNYFKTFYAVYGLSSGRQSEKEYGVEISQRIKNTPVVLRLENFEEYGLKDKQFHFEVYPSLGKNRWVSLSFDYSPNPSFLPRTTFGGEIYQGYKNLEFSFGYTHMDFNDSKVNMFYPGITVYLPKNLVLTEKFYYVPKTASHSFVTSLSYELTCKLLLKYSFGIGNSAEQLTTYGDIKKYNTYFHDIAAEFRINNYISLGLEGLYEHRENLYNEKGVNLFLKYWW